MIPFTGPGQWSLAPAATAVILACLALLLAGPVPALLARSTWPARVPRAAVTLWQSVALAAVLAAVGAGLAAASALVTTAAPSGPAVVAAVVVLASTLVVVVRLGWAGHVHGTRVRARRRRHRDLIDLVARTDHRAPGAQVVDSTARVAYCVPGLRPRVVISGAALDGLDDAGVSAVLEHERGHLRARHDLLLEAFTVLRAAFPHWVRSRTALDAVTGLVEMLADDAARRRTGDLPVARALVALADTPAPTGALAAAAVSPLTRLRRLGEPADRRGRRVAVALAAYGAAAALVAVPTLTVAVPWLAATLPRLF